MIAFFAVGAASTAVRLLPGRAALVSFAFIGTNFLPERSINDLRRTCTLLFLDSGAFSAWSKGTPIDLDRYCDFVHANWQTFDRIATLDTIGDEAASLANWRLMLSRLPWCAERLVPVFHEGEPIETLDAYCARARVVGLGRTAGRRSKPLTFAFYDEVFNRYPTHAFHAFGNGDPQTLEPYPFDSFDCTSWERDSGYANKHGFPWSRATRETRMRAYIEGIESIEHRPPRQVSLRFARGAA